MRADELNAIVAEVAGGVLVEPGWRRVGTTLVFERGEAQLVVRRVELRWRPPAEYTALYRHRFLRDATDDGPPEVPREPHGFPVCVAPMRLAEILDPDWHLPPFGARGNPVDRLDYPTLPTAQVRAWLIDVFGILAEHAAAVTEALTPQRLLDELDALAGPVWIEQRWLEDYRQRLGRS